MKGGDDMKKITFAALLILAAFAVCAWSAKGSEGTRPPAEAGAPAPDPTAEVVEPPQVSPEPVEPAWAEYEATAYCSCEKCCGAWAENRPDGIVYTASGAVAQEGVTIAADWDVLPPGTVVYIDGLGERVVQDRGGDDIFLDLARKGLSVAVCPLPVLNQVNITVTDGKDVAITRNVAAAGGGIVDEIQDMKKALAEVAK